MMGLCVLPVVWMLTSIKRGHPERVGGIPYVVPTVAFTTDGFVQTAGGFGESMQGVIVFFNDEGGKLLPFFPLASRLIGL